MREGLGYGAVRKPEVRPPASVFFRCRRELWRKSDGRLLKFLSFLFASSPFSIFAFHFFYLIYYYIVNFDGFIFTGESNLISPANLYSQPKTYGQKQ